MRRALKLAPPPEAANVSRKRNRGGLKTDREGGLNLPTPRVFVATGAYRIIRNGKPGPWVKGPAERGDDERTY